MASKIFVDCLGFEIGHDERRSHQPFCVVGLDGLGVNLFQNPELAKEHNPEFRLVTQNMQEVYDKVSASHPEFHHPNLPKITLRPWGAKEFALTDCQVGVIIQEWLDAQETIAPFRTPTKRITRTRNMFATAKKAGIANTMLNISANSIALMTLNRNITITAPEITPTTAPKTPPIIKPAHAQSLVGPSRVDE